MTLDRITSLADLAFKARTNKYYEQLVMIAYRYLISGIKVGCIEALESLNNMSVNYNPLSCHSTVEQINDLRSRVKEEVVPKPAPVVAAAAPAVPPASGFSPAVDEATEKLKKIVVDALKKKATHKKKAISSGSTTTNSVTARATRCLGSPRRRSTMTGRFLRSVSSRV
jgi:hypothetical protein